MDWSLLSGGAGFASAPPAPQNANGSVAGAAGGQHVGVIGLVLVAAAILIILHQLDFRFAVTTGRR